MSENRQMIWIASILMAAEKCRLVLIRLLIGKMAVVANVTIAGSIVVQHNQSLLTWKTQHTVSASGQGDASTAIS